MNPFWLKSFHSVEKPLLYRAYLRLLYDVFVGEQGWDLPADNTSGELLPSYYDSKAIISVARNEWGQVIGGIRCSLPGKPIPHEHLFTAHLLHPYINQYRKQIVSLNALAVQKRFRASKFNYGNKNYSLAKHLVDESMCRAIDSGAKIFICSTGIKEAAKLLRSLGFSVLDSGFLSQEPFGNLINMVYVANVEQDTMDYVKTCEEKALGGLDFESFISLRLQSVKELTIKEIEKSRFI